MQFRSVDVAGNTSAWTPATQTAAATVKLDRTAPTTPVATGGSAGWSNAASVIVTATASDAGSGIVSYQHETSIDNGTTWSTPAAGASVSVSAAGKTLVQFQATDGVGLASAWSGDHGGRHRPARSHCPDRSDVGHGRIVERGS